MAKSQPSAVVGDVRGKIGGHVHTKGRYGMVIRTKVSPVQPRTSFQRTIRSRFTGLSKGWSALATDALRSAFDAFARANPIKDVFGNTRTLTGHQMYLRLNAVILQCGGTAITAPPLSLSIAEPTTVAVTALVGSPGSVCVTVTGPPLSNSHAEVWGARPMSAGRKFVGSAYRLLHVFGKAVAGPYYVDPYWEDRLGKLVGGQKIRVLVKYADELTGAQGLGVEASCLATI